MQKAYKRINSKKSMANKESKEDTYSYKGWLNSDRFLKRAFACLGYQMVAGLIIAIPFYAIMFILFIIILATKPY